MNIYKLIFLYCLFKKAGFKTVLSRIETINTRHIPVEVFNIFSSGAIAGYLNQDFYNVKITKDYENDFKEIMMEAFIKQTNS